MNKFLKGGLSKAFTLIELLGVLIVLAVISLITFPIIDESIKNSRTEAYNRAVDSIIQAAKSYSATNDLGNSTDKQALYLEDIKLAGLLEKSIINPKTKEEMAGCVWYSWDPVYNQYDFEYDDECDSGNVETEPTINITYNENLINSNGWAKENIAVTLVGIGNIKYCISSEECEPNDIVATGSNTKFVVNEGTNYICAISSNSLGTTEKKCVDIKLDKTAPTIAGLTQITVKRNETVDLNTGVIVDDNLSGVDGTYTTNPTSVDTTTAGIKTVQYTVKDMAGNVAIQNRTVKVEGELPNIVFTVQGSPFNSNNWAKENVNVRIDVTDNSGLGIKEIKYCKGTVDCEPTTNIGNGETITLEESSATNKICIEAIDNSETSNKICSDNYQIDKVLPTIEGVGDLTVNRNEAVNLTSGVTYNDALSQIDGTLVITPTTVDTSTTGTKQVTYKVQDMAGNIREVVRNIIVDAEAPSIVFNLVDSSAINNNNWANKDFYVRATITDNSGTGIKSGSSCTTNSSSECAPSAIFTGTTKDFLISVEGTNRACIQVTDNNNKTSKVCSDAYNLDKTLPVAGTATFTGTLGSNSWYTTNVTVNVSNGSDALSGHNNTTSNVLSITSNTTGQNVTITTTDLAGNSSTRNYTIKLDKNAPTLTAKSGSVEIEEGASNSVSNYFTVSYGISGGNLVCTPTNTRDLAVGNRTVSCTATGGNGKTTTASKSITVNSRHSFADDSWATIASVVRQGLASSTYNIGDTKEVYVSGYGTFTVRIANMSTPSECNTSGFSQSGCGFVVEFVDIITEHVIYEQYSMSGGYPASSMRTFLNNTIYNALPSDLRNVIINTTVVSGHERNVTSNYTSVEKVYLLSTKEIYDPDDMDTASDSIRQLDYYKNYNTNEDNPSAAIKYYGSAINDWWLRTPYRSNNASFYYVGEGVIGSSGTILFGGIDYALGVAPAFRIG